MVGDLHNYWITRSRGILLLLYSTRFASNRPTNHTTPPAPTFHHTTYGNNETHNTTRQKCMLVLCHRSFWFLVGRWPACDVQSYFVADPYGVVGISTYASERADERKGHPTLCFPFPFCETLPIHAPQKSTSCQALKNNTVIRLPTI